MPSYVAQANTGSDALVSSRAVTKPGGVAAGDVGVFWLMRWSDTSSFPAVTPPAGAVLRGTFVNNLIETSVFLLKINAETTITFSWTGARWSSLAASFFSGVDPALDLSTAPYQAASGAAAPISTLTVSTVNTAALSWCVNTLASSSGITHTPPTNFTENADVAPWSTAYWISTGTGSQSASGATFSPSQIWVSGLVALAPAASSVDKSGSDTGTATESQSIATARTETGTGIDAGTITASLTGTDTASAVDTGVIYVFSSDSGSAVDAGTLSVNLSSSDTGTATEATPVLHMTGVETGSSLETQSLTATLTQTESGALQDNWSTQATLTRTDSLTATENAWTSEDMNLTTEFSAPFVDSYVLDLSVFQTQLKLRAYTEEVDE